MDMTRSLFAPLAANGLTSLKLQYDWRTGEHLMSAGREWEPNQSFSDYGEAFDVSSLRTRDGLALNTRQTLNLYADHGLAEYLNQILDLLRQGRHAGIEAYYHAGRDIRFMCHQHSRKLGLRNRRHAIFAGGIRRHTREEDEIDVVIDGLNLSRAMSFKNIAAGLDFGGSKTTVQMDELLLNDLESIGFLAFAVDRCRTFTGPDMNFPTAMSDIINKHYSPQFTGGPASPLGETGRPTAYGTFLALQEVLRLNEGNSALDGYSIVVIGLGAVGWTLAEMLHEAGGDLHIADLDVDRVERFTAKHPDGRVAPIAIDDALGFNGDILCPAAVGGLLDEETIAKLRYRYVFGPANNQLKATNQAEEERLARLLADRGIFFQTEWWHNTAGVMCGAEEYVNGTKASSGTLYRRIEETIPSRTRKNLLQARALGITPTENAYRTCLDTIYG
ncbi:Glu/Leu/Phe/Val dehydrogenase dimerization domain-containing protein [Brevibacterium sp. FAM 25378]|uniref:Glu/Leu/Phe/Val dehydrogenase dimerization domain-containing protein n=1 Tax=unclassified Brevibacterium TaxID=2614124 RepID=UPI001F0CF4F4|nr:Glu/Leu/Phe/Val dehydrogenase dimerization domain-containing protein [Brevibacterium sp. S22]